LRSYIRHLACAISLILFSQSTLAPAAVLPVEAAPAAQPAPEETPGETSPIATAPDTGSDERISERIQGILSELPGIEDVTVRAEEGVVTLSGTVGSAEDAARAEAIAARVQGVVTVENRIERDVSIGGGLGLSGLGERLNGLIRLLPLVGAGIIAGLVIAGIGYLLASLTAIWRRVAPNGFLAELIASAIRFAFMTGGLVVALDIVGAGALLGAVLGGAGVIGIALGFAMRDTIENYIASLMLSVRQPFRPNDHVLIDVHEGRVIRLTSRATILMTLDGNHLRVPNSAVFRAVILNYTRNPQRRFDFQLGIDADDNPDAARALGREVLGALPWVLDQPPPEARVVEVGDSNIVLEFLGWVDQRETDWFKARSRAIARVKAALEEAGFALPEPIYRLRFDQRSGPVPFTSVAAPSVGEPRRPREESDKRQPDPAKSVSQAHTPDHLGNEDVRPTNEIAKMVDDERSATSAEGDLLDPGRPVE